jgi:alanine-glyoxylate transaminase/serine-glyoxylate transaminase/serine-pyruvate transaminase
VRIGILNQLTPEAITEIAGRFADAMLAMGSEFDKQQLMHGHYAKTA